MHDPGQVTGLPSSGRVLCKVRLALFRSLTQEIEKRSGRAPAQAMTATKNLVAERAGPARALQWPTSQRKHSDTWLRLTWGSERNLLEGGDRGAFWTWFDLHPQLVEWVLLPGDVHVLPEQRAPCCGL